MHEHDCSTAVEYIPLVLEAMSSNHAGYILALSIFALPFNAILGGASLLVTKKQEKGDA